MDATATRRPKGTALQGPEPGKWSGRIEATRRFSIAGSASAPHRGSSSSAYWLFGLTVIASLLVDALSKGSEFIRGQMWAEMATNYYRNAVSDSLFDRLFATDVGYIPFPQRLIGALGELVGIGPAQVPYYYTGMGYLAAALMVSTLALPCFRPVISSDLLRAGLAVTLGVMIDYETRGFINFTYFAVVPFVAVTALAYTRRSGVPAWAWVLPVLLLSKPAVLSVLPAMAIVAIFSGRRFRWITVSSIAVGFIQLGRLALSASTGPSAVQETDAGIGERLLSSVDHFLAFQARFLTSPLSPIESETILFIGGALVVLTVAVVALRTRAGILVVVAISTSAFALLINCISYGEWFSRDLPLAFAEEFDRRSVIVMLMSIVVFAAAISAVLESALFARLFSRIGPQHGYRVIGWLAPAVFLVWLAGVGWVQYGFQVNTADDIVEAPISQWEAKATALEADDDVVCIPIEPWGWAYGRDCELAHAYPLADARWSAAAEPDTDGSTTLLLPPQDLGQSPLASIAVVIRSTASSPGVATLTAFVEGGPEVVVDRPVPEGADGGLIQFDMNMFVPADMITSTEVRFPPGVDVAWSGSGADATPAVSWYVVSR